MPLPHGVRLSDSALSDGWIEGGNPQNFSVDIPKVRAHLRGARFQGHVSEIRAYFLARFLLTRKAASLLVRGSGSCLARRLVELQ